MGLGPSRYAVSQVAWGSLRLLGSVPPLEVAQIRVRPIGAAAAVPRGREKVFPCPTMAWQQSKHMLNEAQACPPAYFSTC